MVAEDRRNVLYICKSPPKEKKKEKKTQTGKRKGLKKTQYPWDPNEGGDRRLVAGGFTGLAMGPATSPARCRLSQLGRWTVTHGHQERLSMPRMVEVCGKKRCTVTIKTKEACANDGSNDGARNDRREQ